MVLSTSDIVVIVSFFLISALIGLYFTKKAGKNLESFFLGGRNLPWYLLGISMVATTFAADTPLAVTELVATGGIAGNWIWWNFAIGGMLTTFFFARLWRRSGVLTEVEFVELRYSGKPASLLRGFRSIYLGLFINVLVIGWVNVAFMTLLEVFFGLGPDVPMLIGGVDIGISAQLFYTGMAMTVVMIYASLSGLLGVVFTDAIQFIIAMIGCIILAVLVLNSDRIGGMSGLHEKLPAEVFNFVPQIGESGLTGTLTISFASFLAWIGFMWWSSWYPGAEPGGGGYIAQRMMSAKNEKHSVLATLFFQLAHYCLRPWPWIIVALCALVLYPEVSANNPRAGYVMAMKEFLPDGLRGLLLVSFLAAYMSTISTQLNWGASYLVNDFYARFLRKNKQVEDRELVQVSRLSTVILMIIGLYITTQINEIKDVWLFIQECGAGLGLVLILRWYWWRINAWSEITATIVPFLVYGVLYGMRNHYASAFDPELGQAAIQDLIKADHAWLYFPGSFFIILGITTVCWLAATFLTAPVNLEHLKHFKTKVNPGGWWNAVKLEEEGTASGHLGLQALCWILAVIFTYSALFCSGKFILGFYQEGVIFLISALVSLGAFLLLMKRSKLFD